MNEQTTPLPLPKLKRLGLKKTIGLSVLRYCVRLEKLRQTRLKNQQGSQVMKFPWREICAHLKRNKSRLLIGGRTLFRWREDQLVKSQSLHFCVSTSKVHTALLVNTLIFVLMSFSFFTSGNAQSLQINKMEPATSGVHQLHANPFDCQLRVEGIEPNLSLVYSDGAIPVSAKALQFEKNSRYVRVFTRGKLFELSVISVRVPFHKNQQDQFKGLWSGIDASSGLPVEGSLLQFQLNRSAKQAVQTLSKALNMKFHTEQRLSPGSDEKYVVYVSDSFTYPKMEIWSDKKTSYLQYQCVLN